MPAAWEGPPSPKSHAHEVGLFEVRSVSWTGSPPPGAAGDQRKSATGAGRAHDGATTTRVAPDTACPAIVPAAVTV